MKYFPKLFAGIFVLFFMNMNAYGAEPIKIAIIDLQKCVMESKEGRKIFQVLKEKKTSMQKKLDEKQAELLLIKEQLEKQNMMLSMDAKEDKRKEWERKGRELKYFLDDLNEEMRKAEGEAKKKILKELEVIVNRIGREGKYHLILERVTGGVVYFSGVIDITGDVIKEYDKTRK